MDDLIDDLGVGRMRTRLGAPRPILQPFQALGVIAAQPGVVEMVADTEVATGHRNVAGHLVDVAQYPACDARTELLVDHSQVS
jgi:hypothetical protein